VLLLDRRYPILITATGAGDHGLGVFDFDDGFGEWGISAFPEWSHDFREWKHNF
jgi:hypothetical protein